MATIWIDREGHERELQADPSPDVIALHGLRRKGGLGIVPDGQSVRVELPLMDHLPPQLVAGTAALDADQAKQRDAVEQARAASIARLNNWRNEPAPVAPAQASRADAAIRDAAVAWNQMIADLNGWREGGSR